MAGLNITSIIKKHNNFIEKMERNAKRNHLTFIYGGSVNNGGMYADGHRIFYSNYVKNDSLSVNMQIGDMMKNGIIAPDKTTAGIFVDHIKMDIKALKFYKKENIILKLDSTDGVIYLTLKIKYLDDIFNALDLKNGYFSFWLPDIKLCANNTVKSPVIFCNNIGTMYQLPIFCGSADIESDYIKQNDLISKYYELLATA